MKRAGSGRPIRLHIRKNDMAETKKIKARVLADCVYGSVDDVVEVTEAEAKACSALDAHKDAVAYAEGLKRAPKEDKA